MLSGVSWEKNSQTKNLIDKLSGLEVDSLEMEKLRRENDDMRQILGAGKISGVKLDPAAVLAISNQSLIVSKNSAVPGQAAVDSRMALLGVAGNTGKWNSVVKLLADPSVKISVKIIISGQDFALGETVGEFGGRIVLEKILTSVDLKDGQPVLPEEQTVYRLIYWSAGLGMKFIKRNRRFFKKPISIRRLDLPI